MFDYLIFKYLVLAPVWVALGKFIWDGYLWATLLSIFGFLVSLVSVCRSLCTRLRGCWGSSGKCSGDESEI